MKKSNNAYKIISSIARHAGSIFFIILVCLAFSPYLHAETAPRDSSLCDNSQVVVRNISGNKISDFKSKNAFDYETTPQQPSVFQSIFKWVLQKLGGVFANDTFRISFFYIVFGILLVIILLQVLQVKPAGLFYRNTRINNFSIQSSTNSYNPEQIHAIIYTAVKNNDYRTAVRYLFIKLLYKLDENGAIQFTEYKTIPDYSAELRETEFSNVFRELASHYQFICYGGFSIGEERFNRLYNRFSQVFETINTRN